METLIAITTFLCVTALMWALFTRPVGTIQRRLQVFRDMAPPPEEAGTEREPSFGERVVRPVVAAMLQAVRVALPGSLLARLQHRLTLAGDPISLTGLLIVWAVCAVGLPVLYVVFAASSAGVETSKFGLTLAIGLVGAYMPHVWLNRRRTQRQTTMMKTLPDAIDLMTTSVEAGLGIDAALAQVAEKVRGPISIELRRVLREMAMGSTRRDALRAFADRAGAPDVQQFVNALIQAEQMGVSLGQVIRVQSDQMRLKRRQRAEQKAHKAPVKITIPLVLFIFPTVLVVILGPACIQLKDAFPK